jgi:Extensin-like protein C-terminus
VALTDALETPPTIPDIHGPGACGGEDLVRLEAIVLPDQRKVALKPAATLRCGMASEVADWVRTDIAPLANGLGSPLSTLENYDSFDCRGRNGVPGALLSEHGRANALDVHAFGLADGRSIGLTDRGVARGLREDVLHSMCKRFTTVLGPGSDGYHEDHIHLDLMQRRSNYAICQWYVWDPMPATAPLMPEPRPEDAPPRQVAAESDPAKTASPSADSARPEMKSDGGKSDEAAPDADRPASQSASDSAAKRSRKKRR